MAKSMGGPPALNAVRQLGNQAAGTKEMLNSLFQLIVFILIGYAMYGHHSGLRMKSSGDSTFIDSLYFTMVMSTTVGYGDIYCDQDNRECKLVTIFFAIVGLIAIGGAIGTIAQGFIEKAQARAKEKQRKMLDEANQLGASLDDDEVEEEKNDVESGKSVPDDPEEIIEQPTPSNDAKDAEDAEEDASVGGGGPGSLRRQDSKSGKIIKKKRGSNDGVPSKDTFASAGDSPDKQNETNEPETVAVQVTKKNQVSPAGPAPVPVPVPLKLIVDKKSKPSGFELFTLKTVCILRCCLPVYVYIAFCFILAAIENHHGPATVAPSPYYKWDVLDTFYFSIITLTTVGFGDLSPKTQAGRLFCAFLLPMGVIALTIVMGLISEELPKVGKGGDKTIKDLLGELNDVIEQDDDGTVTEEEYLLFCLIREQKVDEETLDILRKQFQALDADKSGELDEDDVNILTQKCKELGL